MTFTRHNSPRPRIGWESDVNDRDLARTLADLSARDTGEAPPPRRARRSRLQMFLHALDLGA
jgi:hypothetical protein